MRHLQRLAQKTHEPHQLGVGGETRKRPFRRRHRQPAIRRRARLARQQPDELGVQRGFDVGHGARRGALEAARLAYFLHHLAQQALRVVALAEEAPVERVEPSLAPDVGQRGQPAGREIDPAARPEDVEQGLVAMQQQIGHEQADQRRHRRQQDAARQRVLQAAADDDAEIEHAMAEDRVGEGNRKCQVENNEQGHGAQRDCAHPAREDCETKERSDRGPAHHRADHRDAQPPPLVAVRQPAVVHHESDQASGDVGRSEDKRYRIAQGGRGRGPGGLIHHRVPVSELTGRRKQGGRPYERPGQAPAKQRARKDGEEREKDRGKERVAGGGHPQQSAERRGKVFPGRGKPGNGRNNRDRRRRQTPRADAPEEVGRPPEGDHQGEGDRDQVSADDQPGQPAEDGSGAPLRSQAEIDRPAVPLDLDRHRTSDLEGRRRQVPVDPPTQRDAIDRQDAVARPQAGALRQAARNDSIHDGRDALLVEEEADQPRAGGEGRRGVELQAEMAEERRGDDVHPPRSARESHGAASGKKQRGAIIAAGRLPTEPGSDLKPPRPAGP